MSWEYTMQKDGPALATPLGYLMAAAVLSALATAAQKAAVPAAHLSLARTAELLGGMQKCAKGPYVAKPAHSDFTQEIENSGWGPGRRLAAPPPGIIAIPAGSSPV